MGKYAAEIAGNRVVRSVVGDAEWAAQALGGEWLDTGDVAYSAGHTLVDGEWRPVPPYPSWVWQDGAWVAPKPEPDPTDDGGWSWDEDAGKWVFVPYRDVP